MSEVELFKDFIEKEPSPEVRRAVHNLVLNKDQQAAIDGAMHYLDTWGSRQPYRVSGLAGTGKTVTLIKLVEAVRDRAGMNPAICAPTGKAAHVISNKQTFFKARTLHSVLTDNPVDHLNTIRDSIIEMSAKERTAEVEAELERLYELERDFESKNTLSFQPIDTETFFAMFNCLIVDESSMIGLETLFKPFIRPIYCPQFFFGDYGQLPPVQDKPAIDLQNPDVRLTIIQRQAEGSGIIKLAHSIRERAYVDPEIFAQYDDLEAVEGVNNTTIGRFAPDHQVLVWKNVTRHAYTPLIRLSRGFNFANEKYKYLPLIGEELLFDQNIPDEGIFKGTPFTVVALADEAAYLKNENPYTIRATIAFQNGTEVEVNLNLTDLMPESVRLITNARDDKNARYGAYKQGIKCSFPYALTVHKAQGSEWENVCIIGEYPTGMNEFKEWFYTAVTRASKRVVCVSDMYFSKRAPKKRWTRPVSLRS